jgi:3',5'-cyclic AMP phosphodiesterase CpdA
MTITNTWAVVQMDAYPEQDGETDVVFNVHWTLAGTNGTYSGYVYGSQSVTVDPEAPFTPYADLTEEQVIGWVKDALGEEQVASLEANVAEQIANQVNPPVVTPALPWSA